MKYSSLHLTALAVLLLVSTTIATAVSAEERQCAQTEMKACFEGEVDTLSAEEQALIESTFERFSEEQRKSALNLFSENMGARDAIAAVASKHVPLGLHEAIIKEATDNGADSDFDLPAFEEQLIKLQQTGDIDSDVLASMVDFSPISIVKLPIYIEGQKAKQALIDAQGRLVDAQGRLVDAQGRLVDAQGRLVDAQEARDALEEARDALEAAADAAEGQ